MRSSILAGKTVIQVSKFRNRSGSTWPGHIALKIDPKFIQKILQKNSHLDIILVAGTNGKTTTSKLIQEVLEKIGKNVFRNAAGANLLNGIASALIKHSSMNGVISHNIAIFEIDENNLPILITELSNLENRISIILLNLFRDQLDRYGEVNTVAKNWLEALKKLPDDTNLITNGDDPMLRFIGEESGLVVNFFGLEKTLMKKREISSDVDFLYCPRCSTKLVYSKRSYSHLGNFSCPKCKFSNNNSITYKNLSTPMSGIYNLYNSSAATVLLEKIYKVDEKTIKRSLKNFSPAFGRQELISYKGQNIFLMLSKNPTGFNQSIEAILEQDKTPQLMLLLNDRIPDGRDVSWIWDVDFELLKSAGKIITSGDRAYDMGLRIKYADIPQEIVEELSRAIEKSLSFLPKNKTLYILATYSAMLETRKLLKGRTIL